MLTREAVLSVSESILLLYDGIVTRVLIGREQVNNTQWVRFFLFRSLRSLRSLRNLRQKSVSFCSEVSEV